MMGLDRNMPWSTHQLSMFRLLFGIMMAIHLVYLIFTGAIDYYFISPVFRFSYPGLNWIPVLEPVFIKVGVGVSIVMAAFIALGIRVRLSAIILTAIYGFLIVSTPSFFKHHHYQFLLVSFLLSFIPTDRSLAMFSRARTNPKTLTNLSLELFALRMQMVIPYFFGGLSKLVNHDWVSRETAQMILAIKFDQTPISEILAQAMTYGGMLFDLLIGVLLFVPTTRKLAFVLAVGFNITNFFLFDVDVFPLVMLAGCVLFVAPPKEWPVDFGQIETRTSMLGRAMVGIFLVLQFLIPLRHFVIPCNVFWTGEGYMMGWNMIDSLKSNRIEFTVIDPVNNLTYQIQATDFFTKRQCAMLARFPEFAPQAARFVAQQGMKWNISQPEVRVSIIVSKNGRTPQQLVNESIDLTRHYSRILRHDPWIVCSEVK